MGAGGVHKQIKPDPIPSFEKNRDHMRWTRTADDVPLHEVLLTRNELGMVTGILFIPMPMVSMAVTMFTGGLNGAARRMPRSFQMQSRDRSRSGVAAIKRLAASVMSRCVHLKAIR